MTTPTATPRRVTVVTPHRRMDVGLPLQCTVAELVPQLVHLAGEAPPQARPSAGWTLSRLGEPPLSPRLTVAAAALRDGDVLQLNPRTAQPTPLLFDDVVDAIASAARTRKGAWQPKVGRRLGIAVAAVLFVAATLLTAFGLAGHLSAPLASGGFAVLLALVAGALARVYGDQDAASACAAAGLGAALCAGLTALPPHAIWPLGAEQLAVGLGAATLYAASAAAVLARRLAWFAAAAVAAGGGALVTATVLLFDVPPARASAVAAAAAIGLTVATPVIAMRLARLPLPYVPADMESFRVDERPAYDSEVLDLTSRAGEILTGLLVGIGAIAVGCCAVLATDRSSWAPVLVGLVGTAWLLRSRAYAGAAHRVALVVVGLAVLTVLGVQLVSTVAGGWLVASAVVAVVAAACCLYYAARVVRNLRSPFRGRWLDIVEYVVLIATLPAAGAVLDVYNAVRDAIS